MIVGIVPLLFPASLEAAAEGENASRVAVGVLFRADLPGLLRPADFLYESTTPRLALEAFPDRAVETIRRWWADPMDPTVTADDAKLTNEAISAYVRSHNAAIYEEAIELFSTTLAVIDPGAWIAPLYSQISNPLGYISVLNVDEKLIHRLRQIPVVAETKALVSPLELHLNNAYVASRARALADSLGATGEGITIGILDTGVEPRYMLDIAGSVDVSGGTLIEPSPGHCIIQGVPHGTLVAEAAASHDSLLTGPGSRSRIFDVKIWPTQAGTRQCADINFEQALLDGYAVAVARGLHVVVISSGLNPLVSDADTGGDIISRLVNRNARLGVPTYIAAGNGGENTMTDHITPPGGAWDGITIGAAHTGDSGHPDDASVASYSSYGAATTGVGGPQKPDLLTYGSTSSTTGLAFPWTPSTYVRASGTSFAAPFAAGIGAQLMEEYPVAAAFHPLLHKALLTMGSSVFPLGHSNMWHVSNAGLTPSMQYGYGLIDAVHASQGKAFMGNQLPATFAVPIPAKLLDGHNHRLNALLVTHAADSGIDGLEVSLHFICHYGPYNYSEGGSGVTFGENGAQMGFLLRPDHHSCYFHAFRNDGTTSNVPFVIAINSEIGWSW